MAVSVSPVCVRVCVLMGTCSPNVPEQLFEVGTELLLVSYRPEESSLAQGYVACLCCILPVAALCYSPLE